jgi:hypothetical protein
LLPVLCLLFHNKFRPRLLTFITGRDGIRFPNVVSGCRDALFESPGGVGSRPVEMCSEDRVDRG